jgi:catechol 2,3-dioxygenase-like lactoylglutathione lyase family enzyme
MNKIFDTLAIVQVGIVVRDIEKAIAAYSAALGTTAPQWSWTDDYEKAQTQYRGKPSMARAKLAFFHCGQVDIELIEPDKNPSTWREFLETKGEGMHHIALMTNDMQTIIKKAEEAGLVMVQKGEYTGGRYAYLDGFNSLKTIIELLEND